MIRMPLGSSFIACNTRSRISPGDSSPANCGICSNCTNATAFISLCTWLGTFGSDFGTSVHVLSATNSFCSFQNFLRFLLPFQNDSGSSRNRSAISPNSSLWAACMPLCAAAISFVACSIWASMVPTGTFWMPSPTGTSAEPPAFSDCAVILSINAKSPGVISLYGSAMTISEIGRPLVWIDVNSPGAGRSVLVFCLPPISETKPPGKFAYIPASRVNRHAAVMAALALPSTFKSPVP